MASDLYPNRAGTHSGSLLSSLPQALPIFLGREAEIVKVKQLLNEKHLVTLSGTDGVGKTSLALQVADQMRRQFGDGVFFVPLDFIVSPESISDAIAKNLGIKINPRLDLLEQFLAELSSKNILLILDNLESSIGLPLFLTQLTDRIPSVKIIVTARVSLNLENEAVVEIHGLALPDRDSPDVESFPSVQLFLQHARIFPDFEPDLASIGHICRLVDGMPLAILLASAWAATLSCDQIAHQIEHSPSLHPSGKVSGEYENMIAVFDSIWGLFSETEKRTLMGLSVFKGGFSHQAASKIAGASSFFLDSALNKKIIQRSMPQRYALHISLLQYLQEKLQANPVLATDVEIRHGSYYLGLLRDSEISLGQSDSTSLLEDILADADNIRFAWKLTVSVGNLRLVQSALSPWMSTMWDRGWFKDAIDALELLTIRLAEFSSNDSDVVLIYAQTKKFLGEFYFLIGDYQSGLRELQNGLQRINESDHSKEESEMYRLLGSYNSVSGRNRDTKEMYQLGLVLAEKVGDLSLVYKFINRLAAEAYMEADYQGAIPIAEHALEIARQLEDKGKIVQSLNDLGSLYYAIKKYPRAKELLTETLAYLPDIKSQILEHTIFNTLGRVLTANGEYLYASQIFAQGLDLIEDVYTDPWTAEMLVSISELLNSMKEKPIAIALVNLIVYHPMVSTEVKARAVRLCETLTSEKVQPENRNWSLGQMSRIVGDVKLILDQKKNPQ
jgi:tetratricopeptide (TPR) repeat protein